MRLKNTTYTYIIGESRPSAVVANLGVKNSQRAIPAPIKVHPRNILENAISLELEHFENWTFGHGPEIQQVKQTMKKWNPGEKWHIPLLILAGDIEMSRTRPRQLF